MPVHPQDVFVNCPFDDLYQPLFRAILYAVVRSGYRVRCALEMDNAAQNRIDKIATIIAECRFGIHDISRTETDGTPPLPRFNMPLELGLFMGAQRYGASEQRKKMMIVLDREPYRYQRFISDIAGVDIKDHGDNPRKALARLSDWFRTNTASAVPRGAQMAAEFEGFMAMLPDLCRARRLTVAEVNFADLNTMVTGFVADLNAA